MSKSQWLGIIIILLELVFPINSIISQSWCEQIVVNSIEIYGNEKTKPWVILFESNIKQGEIIPYANLISRLEESKANIMRTGLFSNANLSYVLDGDKSCQLTIKIEVIENWLLFPSIIFELIDRNFNVWWREFDHDFSRTNYGLAVTHHNLTGRRDQYKMKITRGFSDKFELEMNKPYWPSNKRINLGAKISYIEYREIPISLAGSKLEYFGISGENLLFNWSNNILIEYRTNRNESFIQSIEYGIQKIKDSVAIINPDYLLGNRIRHQFLRSHTSYKFSSLDNAVRPFHGIQWRADLTTIMDFNSRAYLTLEFGMQYVKNLTSKLRSISVLKSYGSLIRQKPSFIFYQGIGSTITKLDGYDYYLIDGLDFFTASQSIYYSLFSFKKSLFKFLTEEPKIKIDMKFDFYSRVSTGYANDPYLKNSNPLANKFLGSFSTGPSITINSILKLEAYYAVNHLGEQGIFLQSTKAF